MKKSCQGNNTPIIKYTWYFYWSHPLPTADINAQVCMSSLFFLYRQDQCCILVDVMRDYQSLKSTVTKAIEVASNVTMSKAILKDKEVARWALSKVIYKYCRFKSSTLVLFYQADSFLMESSASWSSLFPHHGADFPWCSNSVFLADSLDHDIHFLHHGHPIRSMMLGWC